MRFAGVIYILHAFQKKSRKGIPKNEIDLIQSRLRDAEHHYKERMGKGERKP